MGLLVQSGLGTGEEERENKVMGLRGVKLFMCIAHDQDTCHILNGEFRAKVATRVAAKLCPNINVKCTSSTYP